MAIFFGSAFRAKSKVYDAVMKRAVEEHLLCIRDIKKYENSVTK
jgi:hypothetical protein